MPKFATRIQLWGSYRGGDALQALSPGSMVLVSFLFVMVILGLDFLVNRSSYAQFFGFNTVNFAISMICFPFHLEDKFDYKILNSHEG